MPGREKCSDETRRPLNRRFAGGRQTWQGAGGRGGHGRRNLPPPTMTGRARDDNVEGKNDAKDSNATVAASRPVQMQPTPIEPLQSHLARPLPRPTRPVQLLPLFTLPPLPPPRYALPCPSRGAPLRVQNPALPGSQPSPTVHGDSRPHALRPHAHHDIHACGTALCPAPCAI
jgi:hypothetical protein